MATTASRDDIENLGQHNQAINHRQLGATRSGSDNGEDQPSLATKTIIQEAQNSRQHAKQIHAAVERRYRDKLNEKFQQLFQTLSTTDSPSLSLETRTRGKLRKSDILLDAICYIQRSQAEIRHMSDEIRRLHEQVQALQNHSMEENKVIVDSVAQFPLREGNKLN
jgi:hypothetical protein